MPGTYTVTLKADGRTETTRLTLAPDPRAPLDPAALRASLDLSHDIAGSLAVARRGYGQMFVAHAAAVALGTPADPALAAELAELRQGQRRSRRPAAFWRPPGSSARSRATSKPPTSRRPSLSARR